MSQADPRTALNSASPARLHRYRIFLASPNDVALERSAVRDIVAQLQGEYRIADHLALQLIAWDQPGNKLAMEAARQPQQSINRGLPNPADCDLFIFLLRCRASQPCLAPPPAARHALQIEGDTFNL